jgi:V/A-type H+-transporting ATPase subunit I
VRIFALNSVVDALIAKLHELGMVDITTAESKGLQTGAPLESFNTISTQLVRLRALKANLPKRNGGEQTFNPHALKDATAITFDEKLKSYYSEIAKLENEIAKYNEEFYQAKRLQAFKGVDFSRLDTRSTTHMLGSVARDKLNKAREELDKLGVKHTYTILEHEAWLLLLFERTNATVVETTMTKYGFSNIQVSPNLTVPEKYAFWLDRELKSRKARIEELKKEISAFADKYYAKINELEYSLSILADRSEIASRFGFTKSALVIQGWIEANKEDDLKEMLDPFGDKAVLESAQTGHHEVAPTVLNSGGVMKPFQFITRNYSFPSANEIDPTILYFITVPLLYGLIVADVVYGLISVLIALFFLKKFKNSPTMQSVGRIWLYSAFPAIIFGLFFDEWGGMTHFKALQHLQEWGLLNLQAMNITGPFYQGLSRFHNLTAVLAITLYVGMIHLSLGLILGFLNEWGHSKKHAIGKLAWIGVIWFGYLAIASMMFNIYPADWGNIGTIGLVVSAILIAVTEGIVGILELPGIAGNVFSYMRIAVVGVVGTILAEIINEMMMPKPEQGLLVFVVLPFFLLLHVLNAFIAMFEAIIQGGRLNIIEFKLKFVKGGGRPFKPFALKKNE